MTRRKFSPTLLMQLQLVRALDSNADVQFMQQVTNDYGQQITVVNDAYAYIYKRTAPLGTRLVYKYDENMQLRYFGYVDETGVLVPAQAAEE